MTFEVAVTFIEMFRYMHLLSTCALHVNRCCLSQKNHNGLQGVLLVTFKVVSLELTPQFLSSSNPTSIAHIHKIAFERYLFATTKPTNAFVYMHCTLAKAYPQFCYIIFKKFFSRSQQQGVGVKDCCCEFQLFIKSR